MRLVLILLMLAPSLEAQVRAPRKPANPPPAPRLKDGTPNLGPIEPNKGYWAPQQYQDYTAIADPREIPFQPWAKELATYRKVETVSKYDLYTLHYEATIDDPGAYTAPWKVRFDGNWDPNGEIQEYICQENNLWKDHVRWWRYSTKIRLSNRERRFRT